jgi:hypothetical protein
MIASLNAFLNAITRDPATKRRYPGEIEHRAEQFVKLAGSKTKRNTDTFIVEVLQCPRLTGI